MRRGFRAEWKAEIRGVLKGLAAVWAGLAVFILLVPLLVVWGSGGFDAGGAGDGQHAGDAAGSGGQGAAQTVNRKIADGFLDADRSRGEPAFLEEAGNQRQRILVLLPHPHVGLDAQALAHRWRFEKGRDDTGLALDRDDHAGQPLAPAPAHAGEIDQRRSRLDQHGADAVRRH